MHARQNMNTASFQQWSKQHRQRVDRRLQNAVDAIADRTTDNPVLAEAIGYALLAGGKRIRPLLVYAAGALSGAAPEQLDAAASAVEMVHCYSLIHDDLPAMDNDELRRGKPTLHIAYDEATAILAGDALLTEAFALLAVQPSGSPQTQLQSIAVLAQASGARGMVAGQILDMQMEGTRPSTQELETMFALKTGALLHASAMLGVLAAGNDALSSLYNNVAAFGRAIGLCFQIQDDIIDVTSSTELLGKPQGSDAARGKPNYALTFGLDNARERADGLYQTAMKALQTYDQTADPLRLLGALIARRDH
jgi:farnesyl diphosphate synthase